MHQHAKSLDHFARKSKDAFYGSRNLKNANLRSATIRLDKTRCLAWIPWIFSINGSQVLLNSFIFSIGIPQLLVETD